MPECIGGNALRHLQKITVYSLQTVNLSVRRYWQGVVKRYYERSNGTVTNMNSVLIVEDDALIGNAMEQWLIQSNRVEWVRSLAEAEAALLAKSYDMVVLDLGLPDGHGFTLLKMMKRKKMASGVLILTAYEEVDSRIAGLDHGADDYLVKPIDFKELDARLRSIMRRKEGHHSPVIEHHDLSFDIHGRTLHKDGEPVSLSNMEVSILSILLQGRGRYFSKSMLEERLYDDASSIEGNSVEVHISALRKKLGKSLIKTTRGLGYIIEKDRAS